MLWRTHHPPTHHPRDPPTPHARRFVILDAIIKHVNEDGRINAFYSNPAEYADAKRKEAVAGAVEWPVLAANTTTPADFFPYAPRTLASSCAPATPNLSFRALAPSQHSFSLS